MPLDREFRDMFPDTIQIQPQTGADLYTKPSYGAAVAWLARVVRKQKQYRAPDGAQALSNAQVWVYGRSDGLPGLPSLKLTDRLILPGGVIQGDGSVIPSSATAPIVAINAFPDESGVVYEVAYLAMGG